MNPYPPQLELDIALVGYRHCRAAQERITDFYSDGRPRFEWERLRQAHVLSGDQAITHICAGCPLNLTATVEGCRIVLEGYDAFVQALGRVLPDAHLLGVGSGVIRLEPEVTVTVGGEVERAMVLLADLPWPVAHALTAEGAIVAELPWQGEEEVTFLAGNNGYHLGLSAEGIVVTALSQGPMATPFARMVAEGSAVYGETAAGDVVSFPPVNGALPAWTADADSRALVFTHRPAGAVFAPILSALQAYSQAAIAHRTGLIFRPAV